MQNITQKQLYNISLKACENMKDARVGKQSVRFCANVEHMVMTEKPWQPTPKGANFSQQRIEQPSVAVSCYFCQKTKRKLFFVKKQKGIFVFYKTDIFSQNQNWITLIIWGLWRISAISILGAQGCWSPGKTLPLAGLNTIFYPM